MSLAEIDDALKETMALIEETRDFVRDSQAMPKEPGQDPMRQLAGIRETSQLTERLTAMLSWLLWHMAAAKGEIEAGELAEKAGSLVEERSPIVDSGLLPESLASLVTRSEALLKRLHALEIRGLLQPGAS